MASFGVTPEGFNLKRLPDIKTELEEANREAFGDIRTDPASNFGQKIGTESEGFSLLWERMQEIYNSYGPNSATGLSLDNVVAYNGLRRLPATSTEVYVGLEIDNGTVVPDDLRAVANGTLEEFQIQEGFTVDYSAVYRMYYEVTDVQDNTQYEIIINAVSYQITSAASGATAQSIADQLATAVDAGSGISSTQVATGVVQVVGDSNSTFADTTVDAKLLLRIPRIFLSLNQGQILATARSIENVSSAPVSGLTSVLNYVEGILGRNVESDSELRTRRVNSLQAGGNATIEAMRTKVLQNVDNVTAVTVIENDDDVADPVSGQDPHSLAFIVSGGLDQDVGDEIFAVKAGGIQTWADIADPNKVDVTVTDSQGFQRIITFTRPTTVSIYIGMNITLSLEETFPTDGEDQIKAALVAFGANYAIGQDVLYQSLFTPIYSIPGVADIELGINRTGAYTPANPIIIPSGDKVNIAIAINEIAAISETNIVTNVL